MDDYFLAEKDETVVVNHKTGHVSQESKIEYVYEPEMEAVYLGQCFKAFERTVKAGHFPFIIVDNVNALSAQFNQFWSTAKTAGFEVYVLETPCNDVAVCAGRNIHGWVQQDIQALRDAWEETPDHFTRMDLGELLRKAGLQTADDDNGSPKEPTSQSEAPESKPARNGKSKWAQSKEDDEEDRRIIEAATKEALMQTRKRSDTTKTVRWADLEGKDELPRYQRKAKVFSFWQTSVDAEDEEARQRSSSKRKQREEVGNEDDDSDERSFAEKIKEENLLLAAMFKRRKLGQVSDDDDEDEK